MSHTDVIRVTLAVHPLEQPTDGEIDRNREREKGGVEDEVAAEEGGDGGGVEQLVSGLHQGPGGC